MGPITIIVVQIKHNPLLNTIVTTNCLWFLFRFGFAKPTISQQGEFNEDDCADWKRKMDGTIEKVRKALDFMRQQFNEVPFIAFYRKEYIRPELKINDLWRVYHFDELWCKLQTRKRNLKLLYQNMMQYQGKYLSFKVGK